MPRSDEGVPDRGAKAGRKGIESRWISVLTFFCQLPYSMSNVTEKKDSEGLWGKEHIYSFHWTEKRIGSPCGFPFAVSPP
jgi:hypothetical protein